VHINNIIFKKKKKKKIIKKKKNKNKNRLYSPISNFMKIIIIPKCVDFNLIIPYSY
jgi:hypothetical protein